MQYATNPLVGRESPWTLDGRQTRHLKQNLPGYHPTRCLVVDDEREILKYVVHMLAMLGFHEVETAQRQPEVNKRQIANSYELLITDLEMPDMNGYRLAQTMKKNAHDIKTIIMTGRHEDDSLEMMATQWVDGWLFKPFGLKELRSMLLLLAVT